MKKIYFIVVLSLIALLLNFLPFRLINGEERYLYEEFDESLGHINSMLKLIDYIDNVAYKENCSPHSLEYNEIITKTITRRFKHRYSHYYLNQNWIAALSGYLFWRDLSAIVKPEDLMKFPNAACSKQSIVMMRVLDLKGIPFRKVGWDHHFALCAFVENRWHYYDPNMEPVISIYERTFDSRFIDVNFLKSIYSKTGYSKEKMQVMFGTPKLGEVRAFPAPKALLFHNITYVLSRTLWIFGLAMAYALYWLRVRNISFKRVIVKGKKIIQLTYK